MISGSLGAGHAGWVKDTNLPACRQNGGVICVDKTGVLTQSKLTVTAVLYDGECFSAHSSIQDAHVFQEQVLSVNLQPTM